MLEHSAVDPLGLWPERGCAPGLLATLDPSFLHSYRRYTAHGLDSVLSCVRFLNSGGAYAVEPTWKFAMRIQVRVSAAELHSVRVAHTECIFRINDWGVAQR